MSLTLYANFISQPSRAVIWALKIKDVDFELVEMKTGSAVFKSDEFKAINPNCLVPAVKDGDFVLTEGMAILQYLGDKYWTGPKDLYPKDAKVRAKINEFLHWHHTNTRLFTLNIFRPEIAKSVNNATPKDLAALEEKDALVAKEFNLLETFLANNDYIAHTDFPTIADFAAYCEIDQLEFMGFEFSKYPKVSAWIARMKAMNFHDEVHQQLKEFVEKLNLRSYQS
ncbi:Glutathione transferase, theta class [Phytophthora palmivora]|uniref:Glutathione transferase, theta class n=1 Tax=Phytophthora palmivora TaxID=4796 RepID=A0A2P4WXA9_9STRA|nr:Glutathione transferase, theta class [Phytophthora palmivora]